MPVDFFSIKVLIFFVKDCQNEGPPVPVFPVLSQPVQLPYPPELPNNSFLSSAATVSAGIFTKCP